MRSSLEEKKKERFLDIQSADSEDCPPELNNGVHRKGRKGGGKRTCRVFLLTRADEGKGEPPSSVVHSSSCPWKKKRRIHSHPLEKKKKGFLR